MPLAKFHRKSYNIKRNAMITRELLRFTWKYEDGIVTLIDKKQKTMFQMPLTYLDSLTRAGIAFKNQYRIEQAKKFQFQHQITREYFKRYKLEIALKRKAEVEKKRQKKMKI